MTANRTGTAHWRHVREAALERAQAYGLVLCPCDGDCQHHAGSVCAVRLNYEVSRQPASAEPDHIRPHSFGGRDELSNVRVVCRRCNQARGSKPPSAIPLPPPVRSTTTLVRW